MDYFPMHVHTAITGVFVLLLIFKYLPWRSRTIGKNHAPPEAGGAWPIIGHLHLLVRTQLPHIALGSLAAKYGPIFTIRLGVHRAVVVSSSELVEEIFTTHDLVALSRPQILSTKYLGYNSSIFPICRYGPYWREIRKIISLELLSNRGLELLKHVRIFETETSIKKLYKKWNENKNGLSGRVLVEMKKWFGDLTLNVILRMVAGKRYFGDEMISDGKEAGRCHKVMRDFFYLMGVFAVGDAVPWLGWLDIGGYKKAMKIVSKEMDNMFEMWLQEHLQEKANGEASGEKDFIDVMLSMVDGSNFTGCDPDTIVKSTCLGLIAGGTDTSSILLVWALSPLLNNRHALRKVQEELDMHVGKERRVNEADIDKLLYLQAVVKETLRLYPVGPLSGRREFDEDCILGGYHIPKGTRLTLTDPLEFRLERFLTTHNDLDVKGHHFELIPFSAGRRICRGINFSLQMIHLVFVNLLHAFEISTPFNEPVDMTETAGVTNIKVTPLDVLIAPRLSATLY